MPQIPGWGRNFAADKRSLVKEKICRGRRFEKSCRSEENFACEGERSGREAFYRRERTLEFHFYP